MTSMLTQDVRWTIRRLRRRPMVALSVVLMLDVGIGLNAAIFAVVDARAARSCG